MNGSYGGECALGDQCSYVHGYGFTQSEYDSGVVAEPQQANLNPSPNLEPNLEPNSSSDPDSNPNPNPNPRFKLSSIMTSWRTLRLLLYGKALA